MKKIFLFFFLFTLVTLATYTFVSPYISSYTVKNIPLLEIEENQFTLVGVIRTSGVTDQMATTWSISKPIYQITNLKIKPNYSGIEFDGAYLVNSNIPMEKYLGRCVQLKVGMQDLSKPFINKDYTVNGEYTYKNLLLYPLNVQPLVYSLALCNPYGDKQPTEEKKKSMQGKTFTGTMGKITRPAPGIGYDYELILDVPYTDPLDASGLSARKNSLIVVPSTNKIWEEIERNMGRRVIVNGYATWGYAESRYLLVTSVEKD